MAGSYEAALWHPSLLENMGDAGEAIEQMLWLILRGVGHEEAVRLINEEWGPMVRGERPMDEHLFRLATRLTNPYHI